MSFTLIDTDILIDLGRGVNDAIDCVQRIEQQSALATSAITQMELIIGCRNKTEMESLEVFLRRFQIPKLTIPISDKAVSLLRSIG